VGDGNVHLAVAEVTRVCRYTRTSTVPVTSQQIAQDLHDVLLKMSIGPPYIVVGTELGGFTTRVFTAQFPEEVVGLMLINAFHPDAHARFTAVIPPAQPADSAELQQLREFLAIDHELYLAHGTDYTASAAQARATGPFGDLPLVVITAGKPAMVPDEVRADWERVELEMQTELTQLSTNSTQIIAEQSDNCVQCTEPELVIEAIREVVDAARNGSRVEAAD
jgi:pimeloyl-ACP methyl ester carboxylesterase